MQRRDLLKGAAAAGVLAASPVATTAPRASIARPAAAGAWDVAVVGAGVFGAWTAHALARAGQRVVLLDAYGPGNSRATSGGETRIIRISYGPNALYSEWTLRSLAAWRELSAETGVAYFTPTGVLRLASDADRYAEQSVETLACLGVRHERLGKADLERRFPQIGLDGIAFGLYEPDSGSLLARRSVQALVERCRSLGATLLDEAALPPRGNGSLPELQTRSGNSVRAGKFVFACGPWLPRLFPEVLGGLIDVTRAEVFFLGVPAAERRFAPPVMPAWIDDGADTYGVADIEGRGFKIGLDPARTPVDPDTQERVVPPESLPPLRAYVRRRFPALEQAPIVETRVCQYEETPSGDFIVDRHPDFTNVWIAGGGSGHGFKMGPAVGEHTATCVLNGSAPETRFTLDQHREARARAVR